MTQRENQQVEEKLMAHYIQDRGISRLDHVTHLRVGQHPGYSKSNPEPLDQRNQRLVSLDEADLVVRNKTSATIYEFAVWRPTTKISQIEGYRLQLVETPGYMHLKLEDVDLQIVSALEDNVIKRLAEQKGIRFEVFPDPEVLEILASRRGAR